MARTKKALRDLREEGDLRETGLRLTSRQEAYRNSLLRGDYKDELYIDPDIIPDGMEYLWATDALLGQPADANIASVCKRGYDAVPAERHPEMCAENFMGRGFQNNGKIVRKGLILCERPKELGELERYKQMEHNIRIMKDMKGIENVMGEPEIPARFLHNETVMANRG